MRLGTALLMVSMVGFNTCFVVGSVHANGRLPNTTFLRINPTNPNQWLLGATFGLLVSSDGGASFQWICEQAANGAEGFQGADPGALWAGSALVLAPYDNITLSRDGGCSWEAAPYFNGQYIQDLVGHPSDSNTWYVVSNDPTLARGIVSVTTDGGKSYQALALSQHATGWNSLRVAPSMATRMVAAGWNENTFSGPIMAVSNDSGANWSTFEVVKAQPSDPNLPLQIADPRFEISPADPNTVLLCLTDLMTTRATVLRVDLGNGTARIATVLGDGCRGLTFSGDGQTVWISTLTHVMRSSDGGQTFAPLPSPTGNACTNLNGDALYGCGNDVADHFSLARSQDGGNHWTPLFSLNLTTGPVSCPSTTQAAEACTALWPGVAGPIHAGQGVLGTTTGVGAGSSSGGGTAGSGTNTGVSEADPKKTGCTCSAPALGKGFAMLACVAWLRSRRRRDAASPGSIGVHR